MMFSYQRLIWIPQLYQRWQFRLTRLCNLVRVDHESNIKQVMSVFIYHCVSSVCVGSYSGPYMIVALGYFNAQTKIWYESSETTHEWINMDRVTSQFRFKRLTHQPTHIIGETSSCIDIICTSQPNLVIESGILLPRHRKLFDEKLREVIVNFQNYAVHFYRKSQTKLLLPHIKQI